MSANSFASRLGDAAFMGSFAALRADVGSDNAVRLMSSNSFASRLGDAAFMGSFAALRADIGSDDAVRLMSINSSPRDSTTMHVELKFIRFFGYLVYLAVAICIVH